MGRGSRIVSLRREGLGTRLGIASFRREELWEEAREQLVSGGQEGETLGRG